MLVSFDKPYNAVTMNTINRRIKNFLKSPLLIYKCSNSIGSRAASCSKAKYDGVHFIEILRSARFSNNSTFGKFYNTTVMFENSFWELLLVSVQVSLLIPLTRSKRQRRIIAKINETYQVEVCLRLSELSSWIEVRGSFPPVLCAQPCYFFLKFFKTSSALQILWRLNLCRPIVTS